MTTRRQDEDKGRKKPTGGVAARDWVILPLLALGTTVALFCITEVTGRVVWGNEGESNNCPKFMSAIVDQAQTPHRPHDTTCWTKIYESPQVESRINSCGCRSDWPCPKPPDTYRIVVIGSSIAYGMYVPYADTFAALLPAELSQATGRKVDMQNLPTGSPYFTHREFQDALALKPDTILWVLTSNDMNSVISFRFPTRAPSLLDRIRKNLRSPILLENLMLQSPAQTVMQYAKGTVNESVMVNPSSAWQAQLKELDAMIGDLAVQAEGNGAKLVLAYIPERPVAIMLTMHEHPAGMDPWKPGRDVEAMARRHGAVYIDLESALSRFTAPGTLYYPVEGHLNAKGQAFFAPYLAQGFLDEGLIAKDSRQNTSIDLATVRRK